MVLFFKKIFSDGFARRLVVFLTKEGHSRVRDTVIFGFTKRGVRKET
jgi:hypothetical protein